MFIATLSFWNRILMCTLLFLFGTVTPSFAIHDFINSFRKSPIHEVKNNARNILPAEIRSPFKFIGGLMFVTVQVNGIDGLFLLDTGSNGFVLLNSDYFKSEKTDQKLKGMSAEVAIERVAVNELSWQNLKLKKQFLPAVKLSQLNHGGPEKVLGLIGSAFFKSYQLSLNFASREMVLSKEEVADPKLNGIPASISIPFTLLNNFPIVDVKIVGQSYRFIMDTGATDNVMDLELESKISSDWQQTQEVKMVEGSGKGTTVRRGKLRNMWIGGLNMQGIGMGLHEMPDFDRKMEVSGILGFQFLKYFYVQINYIENTMKFYDMAAVLK